MLQQIEVEIRKVVYGIEGLWLFRASKARVDGRQHARAIRKPAPTAPEVPTVKEAGYPALELESLVGLFGPRGMPSELRERIAAILGEVAAADPVIATRLAVTGQIVNVRGPAEFTAAIEQQRAKLAEIAKILGIKSDQ